MADLFDKRTRSRIMSRIRSNETKPELALKRALRGKGYCYQPKMLCNPDFANKKKKIVVFVDGDFWHGYNWKKLGKIPPKTYWQAKIEKTIQRDIKNNRLLKENGWKVIRIWEHELENNPNKFISKIKTNLND